MQKYCKIKKIMKGCAILPTQSPLRYPGGKSRLTPIVKTLLENNNINGTYIEPFAGGSGVALQLLIDGVVNDIVINDYDKAIYSVWRAIKENHTGLIRLIEDTPITVEEWRKQKRIYLTNNNKYSLELAFATLFLNRTNHSGILSSGPIGGYKQNGNYKINVRFNKTDIICKIRTIAAHREHIHIYNKDIISFIDNILPRYANNSFVYFDPPYFNKGSELYKNYFTLTDHVMLHDKITKNINIPWLITYDNAKEIIDLYKSDYKIALFDLSYGTSNRKAVSEIAILHNNDFSFIKNIEKFNFRMMK